MLQKPMLKLDVVTFSFPPKRNTRQFLLSHWATIQNGQMSIFLISLSIT